MKTWKLNSQQHIATDQYRNVYFKHDYDGDMKGITLSWRQFLNLNDIILDLKTFHRMKFYPLGNRVWLQYYKNRIQIYHCYLTNYFTFHELSWKKYIRETHRQIRSFLRHEWTTLYRRKHASSHETLFQDRSRYITTSTSKQQILSGSPSNADREDEQRKESTNLPKRDCANSRRPFSFIGAVHALGIAKDAARDMEEGEVYDFECDSGQYSDLCSIE